MASQIHQIRHTDDEWMEIINECRHSGLSDSDWCQEHDISKHTFYKAVARLRRKACELPSRSFAGRTEHQPHDIVRISLENDKPATGTPDCIRFLDYTIGITYGNATIHLSNDADINLAEDVIRMAGRLLC